MATIQGFNVLDSHARDYTGLLTQIVSQRIPQHLRLAPHRGQADKSKPPGRDRIGTPGVKKPSARKVWALVAILSNSGVHPGCVPAYVYQIVYTHASVDDVHICNPFLKHIFISTACTRNHVTGQNVFHQNA